MTTPAYRLILPFFGGLLAGALGLALGAPWAAAIPMALLGAAAAWLLDREPPGAPAFPTPDQSVDRFVTARPLIATLMDAIHDPLFLVEAHSVIMANEAAQQLLGAHIVGQDARLAIRHPEATLRISAPIDVNAAPVRIPDLGGPGRHWDLIVHAFGSDRRLVRLVDRSDTLAAERMRVDFVANASHELRTPLATLVGFIETLEGPAAEDPAIRARFLGIMAGEAKRMAQLVDDLISLSRIEAEKHSPPAETVPLEPLAAMVAHDAGARAPDRLIDVDATEPGLAVRGDGVQLGQLLDNLVGNAIKYGRAGTPIRIRLDRHDQDHVRLAVADEGDGIAPEHLPRLTERFYRVDAGRSRAVGGTGLGLAIVKHIVERHGGRLEIASEPGLGTTVSVILPGAPEALS